MTDVGVGSGALLARGSFARIIFEQFQLVADRIADDRSSPPRRILRRRNDRRSAIYQARHHLIDASNSKSDACALGGTFSVRLRVNLQNLRARISGVVFWATSVRVLGERKTKQRIEALRFFDVGSTQD